MPVREYWSDLLSFFRPFLLHDDFNSDCRAVWSSAREVALVMDAAEALKHQRRREHQSAYFQRLSSQIWVVVLYTHLDDLSNITEAERTKLRELFQEAGIRTVLRETHFFISQD